MKTIEITVNGLTRRAAADEDQTLLGYLRETLRLYGAKNGCARGQCGACTVLVDGAAKRACVLRLARLDGARVETIEGLASGDELHPLQRAFVQAGAVQCGFCTPGMILAAKALLDRNPAPSRAAARATPRSSRRWSSPRRSCGASGSSPPTRREASALRRSARTPSPR
jgi:carbon-monoxide dehydrogenase small subunit